MTAIMGTRIIDPRTILTVFREIGGTGKLHMHCGAKGSF
ncbi:hypothetical protein ACSAZL_19000 [Methanosarcina sp. T3]